MATVENTFIFINLVAAIASLPGNVFIIVVNILDFCKNRKPLLGDQLLFGFSAFSFLHGLQEVYTQYNELFQLPSNEFNRKIAHVFLYLTLCTIWFSTLLSIHFCLKIVNVNHRFYIGLQRKFPKLFPWIIISVVVGYFFLSLYSALETRREDLLNATSKGFILKDYVRRSWLLLIFMIICGLCALLCSASALTILISLFKHMIRMQENVEGSGSPNIDAHIRAVKTITTLLTANILIFTSMSIMVFNKNFLYLFSALISICYIFSSYFLIKGTKKLYIAMAEILNQCSRFCGECHEW